MRKRALLAVAMVVMLASLLLQGCATTFVPLNKRDPSSLAPLRIANDLKPYEGVRVWYSGGETISVVLGCLTLIGGIIVYIPVRASERSVEKEMLAAEVPRYYEVVMKKFVERAGKEIPGWPPMVVEERPVDNHYAKAFLQNKLGSLLLLIPEHYYAPLLSTTQGFEGTYRAMLYDSEGNVLWKKRLEYSSKKYDRYRSIEEYKADNFKLLKGEMEFAADTIVSDFIADIKKEIGVPPVPARSEGEQSSVSPEKLSQEQTQQKEISKDSGIISITSDPRGAKIFIDGEYKGQTPADISLTIGTHQLFLQQQLYAPYKDSVVIEKGQAKTLNIKLSPEGGQQK
jgi:hypothetical protein